MSAMEQSATPDAEINKVYTCYIQALSGAMIDKDKVHALEEFYAADVALYGWFGEISHGKNSRATVLVRAPTLLSFNCCSFLTELYSSLKKYWCGLP